MSSLNVMNVSHDITNVMTKWHYMKLFQSKKMYHEKYIFINLYIAKHMESLKIILLKTFGKKSVKPATFLQLFLISNFNRTFHVHNL